MTIEKELSDNNLILKLSGELDASSSVSLDSELNNPEISKFDKILIDCKDLNYISSAGLGVFISHLQKFEDTKTKLVFFQMQDKVKNVFEILGLDVLMTIVPSLQDAKL